MFGLLTTFNHFSRNLYLLLLVQFILLHYQLSKVSDFASFVFCKGYSMLQNNLALLLEEGDLDSDLRFKTMNITKMATYILTQMMRGFEEKLSQKSNSGILIDIGKVRYCTSYSDI
jgi:hypothetical protein